MPAYHAPAPMRRTGRSIMVPIGENEMRDVGAPDSFSYASLRVYAEGAIVAPLLAPGNAVEVSD